jgi:hypothetical protein
LMISVVDGGGFILGWNEGVIRRFIQISGHLFFR